MTTVTLFRKLSRAIDYARDTRLGRRASIFAHNAAGTPRVPALFVPDIEPSGHDVEIARRLIKAYEAAIRDDARDGSRPEDVWSDIARRQRTFFDVLARRDPECLAAYLCNMSRHDATHGTVQGAIEYKRLKRSRRYRRFVASMAKDKLVSLAEAVGALPCENPEQGSWGSSVRLPIDELVGRIERTVGMNISPPPIDGGLFKIGRDGTLFNERDCNAIYTAWLIRQEFGANDSPSVAEIGGGVGRVAYWSHRFGMVHYTIFDLAHINVLQGYYILKSLPDLNICLYGESGDAGAVGQAGGSMAILPAFAKRRVTGKRFDLVLNQDSFPEIHEDVVRDYLGWMKASARQFLSINHESRPRSVGGALQNRISDLICEIGGYRRLSRQLYWLRKGYVVESYAMDA